MEKRRKTFLNVTGFALVGLAVVAFPFNYGQSYVQYTLDLIGIYGILAIGLMVLIGYTGQVSIGHSAFMGLGAYTSAILTIRFHWPFWLALPLAGLLAGCLGYVIGYPAARLQTVYFSVLTLGLAAALPEILIHFTGLTNGWTGLTPVPPEILGFSFASNDTFYFVITAIFFFLLWIAHNLITGKYGRAFVATRESPLAAQAMGIHVPHIKALALAFSGFYAAVAGVLFAFLNQFINPDNFSLPQSFLFLAMVIVGGMKSVWGALLGATLFTVLQPLTAHMQALQQIITGAVMIIVMLFLPDGLSSLGAFSFRRRAKTGTERMAPNHAHD